MSRRWSLGKLSGLQDRFERSLVGEAAISGLVAVILIIGMVWDMPDAAIRRKVVPVVTPIALSAGLDQYWGMFSPNPPRRLEFLEIHVIMADGQDRMWSFERGDLVFGTFSWYRWHKLKETAVRSDEARYALAHWVVRKAVGPSERAVRVQVILHTEMLPGPGTNEPKTTAAETLLDEQLTGPS